MVLRRKQQGFSSSAPDCVLFGGGIISRDAEYQKKRKAGINSWTTCDQRRTVTVGVDAFRIAVERLAQTDGVTCPSKYERLWSWKREKEEEKRARERERGGEREKERGGKGESEGGRCRCRGRGGGGGGGGG